MIYYARVQRRLLFFAWATHKIVIILFASPYSNVNDKCICLFFCASAAQGDPSVVVLVHVVLYLTSKLLGKNMATLSQHSKSRRGLFLLSESFIASGNGSWAAWRGIKNKYDKVICIQLGGDLGNDDRYDTMYKIDLTGQ